MSEQAAGFFRDRPITGEERKLAAGLVYREPILGWLARTALYTLLALGVVYLAYMLKEPAPEPGPIWQAGGARPFVAPAVLVLIAVPGFCLLWRVREHRARSGLRRQIAEDAASGQVEAARIRPLDVAQLDFPGRRPPSFVFRIDPDRAVVVHLVNVSAPRERLPCEEFEYVRLRRTKHTLRVVAGGRRIKETKHLEGPNARLDAPDLECEPFRLDWDAFTKGAVVQGVHEGLYD